MYSNRWFNRSFILPLALPVLASLVVSSPACKSKEVEEPAPEAAPAAPAAAAKVAVDRSKLGAFAPLPEIMDSADNPLSEAKIELGRMLYFDKRLSKAGDISCNTCHLLDKFGVDSKPVSEGHGGQKGPRNAPTVYNAAGHIAQFWDGREPTVEAQAKGPILNPKEMAMPNARAVMKVVAKDPAYRALFKKAFPDSKKAVSFDNLANAIGAFERKLLTPGRWDKFLGGDDSALTDPEKQGLMRFIDTGCTTCHSGPYLGGHMYQKLGLVKPWPTTTDEGRFAVTKMETDKMVFKVPSLRNIEKTGPYFHDGSVADLGQAVKMMADHQIGKPLSDADVASIVAFLGALTGDVPTDYIAEPQKK